MSQIPQEFRRAVPERAIGTARPFGYSVAALACHLEQSVFYGFPKAASASMKDPAV